MKPRCLLVIACCGWSRRSQDDAYDRDRALYLKQIHHSLSRLRYKCDVTLVSNGGTEQYLAYLKTLEAHYGVLERENTGLSHAAYNHAWRENPGYEFYILIEDDYMFVLDDFDSRMAEMMDERPEIGMLCSVVDYCNGRPFPGHQNGIIRDVCLAAMGGISSTNHQEYSLADQGQIVWGACLEHTRFSLADMGERFRAPFWSPNIGPPHGVDYKDGCMLWYQDAPEALLVPSQMYRRDHDLADDHPLAVDSHWDGE